MGEKNEVLIDQAKDTIDQLYDLLSARPDQSATLLDITDVLEQVYKKLDTAKNPEALLNKLVNYIRFKGKVAKLCFPKPQEALIDDLAWIAIKAGWNGSYRADFEDKRQFYSLFEKMPRRE